MNANLTFDTRFENSTPTILKLGGSLLNVADLAERLVRVVDAHQISRPLILVGGGCAADLVRQWDKVFHLHDSVAHDLAIQAMSLNSKLFAELHARFELADCLKFASVEAQSSVGERPGGGVGSRENSYERAGRAGGHVFSAGKVVSSRITIIEPVALLQQLEQTVSESDRLVRSWRVTSDSIAAWLAMRLGAQRLVLLKSRPLPESYQQSQVHDGDPSLEVRHTMLERLSKSEVVDAAFSNYASNLPHLSWCNLRDSGDKTSASELVDVW